MNNTMNQSTNQTIIQTMNQSNNQTNNPPKRLHPARSMLISTEAYESKEPLESNNQTSTINQTINQSTLNRRLQHVSNPATPLTSSPRSIALIHRSINQTNIQSTSNPIHSRRNSLSRYNPIGLEDQSISQTINQMSDSQSHDQAISRPNHQTINQTSWRARRPQSLTAPFSSNAVTATTITASATSSSSINQSNNQSITSRALMSPQSINQFTPMTQTSLLSPVSSASSNASTGSTNPSRIQSTAHTSNHTNNQHQRSNNQSNNQHHHQSNSHQQLSAATTSQLIGVLSPSLLGVLTNINAPPIQSNNYQSINQSVKQSGVHRSRFQRRPKRVDIREARNAPATPIDQSLSQSIYQSINESPDHPFRSKKVTSRRRVPAPILTNNQLINQSLNQIESAPIDDLLSVDSSSTSRSINQSDNPLTSPPSTASSRLMSPAFSATTPTSFPQTMNQSVTQTINQSNNQSINQTLFHHRKRTLTLRVRHSSVSGAILVDEDVGVITARHSINQSNNQSNNHNNGHLNPLNHSLLHHINLSNNQSNNQSVNAIRSSHSGHGRHVSPNYSADMSLNNANEFAALASLSSSHHQRDQSVNQSINQSINQYEELERSHTPPVTVAVLMSCINAHHANNKQTSSHITETEQI